MRRDRRPKNPAAGSQGGPLSPPQPAPTERLLSAEPSLKDAQSAVSSDQSSPHADVEPELDLVSSLAANRFIVTRKNGDLLTAADCTDGFVSFYDADEGDSTGESSVSNSSDAPDETVQEGWDVTAEEALINPTLASVAQPVLSDYDSSSTSSASPLHEAPQEEKTEAVESSLDEFDAAERDAPRPIAAKSHRQHLHGVVMETHAPHGFATVTLVALSRPLSIRSPCAVWPISGASSVNGYIIQAGSRFAPWAQLSAVRGKECLACVAPLPAKSFAPLKRQGQESVSRYQAEVVKLESVFGPVDWTWVERVSREWKDRLGALPSTTVLLVSAAAGIDTSRAAHKRAIHSGALGQSNHSSLRAIPTCISHREVPLVSAPLLSGVLPPLLKATPSSIRLIVVGEQGVGKSTLARELVNAFISRNGGCLLLDLDPGQGELTPPGSIALAVLTQPLLSASILSFGGSLLSLPSTQNRVLRCAYIGASQIRDPCVASQALAALCEAALDSSSSLRLPLVVNTHGWIHGFGRRYTFEALRRLRPSHVVHLRLATASDWVSDATKDTGCSSIAHPASGLNEHAIRDCGTAALSILNPLVRAAPVPESQEPQQLRFHLLGLIVKEQYVRQPSARAALREERWRAYFRDHSPLNDAYASDSSSTYTTSAMQHRAGYIHVPLSKVGRILFSDEDDLLAVVESQASPAKALTGTLVALGVTDTLPVNEASEPSWASLLTRCTQVPRVIAFAIVEEISGEEHHEILRLRCPLAGATAKALGCNCLIVAYQATLKTTKHPD